MEDAKAAQKIAHHAEQSDEFIKARARAFQKNLVSALRLRSQRGFRQVW